MWDLTRCPCWLDDSLSLLEDELLWFLSLSYRSCEAAPVWIQI